MPGAMDTIWLALLLILPVSALLARRLPIGELVKMALAWLAIFTVAFSLIALWQGATGMGTALGNLLSQN